MLKSTIFRKTNRSQLYEALKISIQGGSSKDHERHTKRNKKLLVHDRLHLLLDDYKNDFVHFSTCAGYKLDYGTIPSAGIISGIGSIKDKKCVVIAMDATVKGGTMYPISVQKMLRAQEIALKNKLPTVYVVDSGGAFLPLQREVFNPGGKIFRNIAWLSAQKISQVSIVVGSCTAGAAYIPTMCDQTVIVDKISSIFLGGPPLVQAATGELVTPEQLGGARIHSEISGYTDFFAEDEYQGFEEIRNICETINCWSGETTFDETISEGLVGNQIKIEDTDSETQSKSPTEIIDLILDPNKTKTDFKPTYSKEITCRFGYINQNKVGIIINNSDNLSDKALNMASHFTQLCSDREDIKCLILIQNGDAKINHQLLMKENGKSDKNGFSRLISSLAVCDTPRITIITDHQNEDFNILSSRYFDSKLVFRWPGAGFKDLSAEECSGKLLDDGIIFPGETRKVLSKVIPCLKRNNVERREPVYRM